jgi:hypothetical protein
LLIGDSSCTSNNIYVLRVMGPDQAGYTLKRSCGIVGDF